VDGITVNSVRRSSAQALVLKWSPAEVEHHKAAAGMPPPDVVFVAGALLEALDVGVGDGIDEMGLAGTQGSRRTEFSRFGLPTISSR